jgi:hypothetical protein
MIGMRLGLVVSGLAAACVLALPVRADGLAVKPGLWESSSSSGSGAPRPSMAQIPPEQLARMTPEQQAMIRQRLSGGGGGAQPTTHRYCVTQAMIQKGFTGPDNDQRCTRTIISNTASAVEVRIVCTGEHPATGTISVRATDAASVAGTMDMTVSDGHGGTMPIHSTFQSRWLGADCGDVKPRE